MDQLKHLFSQIVLFLRHIIVFLLFIALFYAFWISYNSPNELSNKISVASNDIKQKIDELDLSNSAQRAFILIESIQENSVTIKQELETLKSDLAPEKSNQKNLNTINEALKHIKKLETLTVSINESVEILSKKNIEIIRNLHNKFSQIQNGLKQKEIKTLFSFVDLIKWPLIVILALYAIFFTNNYYRLLGFFRRIRQVSLFGTEFQLNTEQSNIVIGDINASVRSYREEARLVLERWSIILQIRNKLRNIVDETMRYVTGSEFEIPNEQKKLLQRQLEKMRFTLHIPDLIYEKYLYQLLDYYPGGLGSGRITHQSFGILGQSWRGQRSMIKNVPTEKRKLVGEFGMDIEQAENAGRGRTRFICILLQEKQELHGVLYGDGKEKWDESLLEDAKTQLIEKFEDLAKKSGLIEALSNLHRETKGSPFIEIK